MSIEKSDNVLETKTKPKRKKKSFLPDVLKADVLDSGFLHVQVGCIFLLDSGDPHRLMYLPKMRSNMKRPLSLQASELIVSGFLLRAKGTESGLPERSHPERSLERQKGKNENETRKGYI